MKLAVELIVRKPEGFESFRYDYKVVYQEIEFRRHVCSGCHFLDDCRERSCNPFVWWLPDKDATVVVCCDAAAAAIATDNGIVMNCAGLVPGKVRYQIRYYTYMNNQISKLLKPTTLLLSFCSCS